MLPTPPYDHGRFGQRFLRLFLLGLAGVASLPLVLVPMVRAQRLPHGMRELPIEALVALSLVNPTLLLAIFAAVGAWLAPKLAFVSLVASLRRGDGAFAQLRAVAPLAVTLGLAAGALIVALDALFQPLLSAAWREAAARAARTGSGATLVSGLLYGGISEEIMLRWGVLSLVAWMLWRLLQRAEDRPARPLLWAAIVVSALLFGAGHLPAAATLAPLDPALVLRTVVLNALPGLCFGWLFVRHHLEAAMLAHASAHVSMAVASWAGALAD